MSNDFMGIPISGDVILRTGHDRPQRPASELAELFKPVLADEAIVSVSWEQYTPYFNDGDVCEFRTYDVSVRTIWDAPGDEDIDRDALYVGEHHPTLAERPISYVRQADWRYKRVEGDLNPNYSAERYAACKALGEAISGYAFENALYEMFGDHARITVTRDGITIDYYEHD